MSPSRGLRTVVVTMTALVVAVILVLAAVSGPSGVVEDLRTDATTSGSAPDEPEAQDQPPADRATDRTPQRDFATGLTGWLHELLAVLAVVVGLWLSAGVVRLLALGLGRRLPEAQLVLELDPLTDTEVAREALRRDRTLHDVALAGSDVRNGIVACWVLLEEAAAEHGIARRPAETATELVVRFLHALDVDPRPVAELAELFLEARFSSHPLPDGTRSRARAALAAIHAELDRVPTR